MKKYAFIIAISLVISAVALASFGKEKPRTLKAGETLSVSDIQADPYAYKGTITVTGVVAVLSKKDPKVFAIIDTREAKACKSTGCARFYLPVRHEGVIPEEWDEVNITGSIVKKRGPLFEATKIDVLRHLTF